MIAVRDLRKAMHEIAARKGNFTLFALFMPAGDLLMAAGDPGTWDLVVSAPWLEGSQLKAFKELLPLLVKSIGRKAFQQLSRVAILPGNDPRTRFILKSFPMEDGELHIQNTDLIGMMIERGIIFRSWKPRAKKPAKRKLQPVAAGSARSRG